MLSLISFKNKLQHPSPNVVEMFHAIFFSFMLHILIVFRHTVASSWLPRLLGIVVGDVPAGKAASSSCQAGVGGVNANGTEESGGNLTKVFITVFNGVVDYMPQARG